MTRGVNIVLAIFCIVGAVAVVNAALAPSLGVQKSTGLDNSVNETNSKFKDDVEGSVTNQGEFSPLSAAGMLTKALSLLPNVGKMLVNLGVPPELANFVGFPAVFVAGITMIAIVLRFRL